MDKRVLLVGASITFVFATFTTASAQPSDPGDGDDTSLAEFADGELLVRFRPGVGPARAQQVLNERGAAEIGTVPGLDVRVLRLPPGLSVERAVEVFSALPGVEYAEPNYILQALGVVEIDDQWGLKKIQGPEAWGNLSDQEPVVIAVVDTGVDRNHLDLSPNIWENSGEVNRQDGFDDDDNGFIDDTWGWDFHNSDNDPFDDQMHGTLVSSVAAAAENGSGVAGVCPWCLIQTVKVLGADGSGTLDNVANGIIYAADNGARVVSLSLGGYAGSITLENAVNYAWGKDALVVAAAGNDGGKTQIYPAAYANAMSIGSTNDQDHRSCFSNYGDGYVSVAAPGEAVIGAIPNNDYGTFSGTSLSTPHASGIGGLLFSQDSGRTNAEVRGIIESTTNDLGPVGADAFFGTGRINALRAVNEDSSSTAPPGGLFSDDLTATGYAHARKLARDEAGGLHLAWHGADGGQYRVLYSYSGDAGASWSSPENVFSSSAETFHAALALGEDAIHIAFPSKHGSNPSKYKVYVTAKPLGGGGWSAPQVVLGGNYNAVRPDLHHDPGTAKLHLVASSFDDARYVYYSSSGDGGNKWSNASQVNLSSSVNEKTRYADVYASGSNIYITGRTVELTFFGLIPRYRLTTTRSTNNGNAWEAPTELALYEGWLSGEYGASLSGVGDELYLVYEHGGSIYFRSSSSGAAWTGATSLGAGAWPSITQASDGQAWAAWESGGRISLRHFTGSSWDPAESLGTGNYPNLKFGTDGDSVEWVASHCSGAPYRVFHGSQSLTANNSPEADANGPYSAMEDAAITFDGVGSSDLDGDPLTYSWDFGDGATGSGATPSHTYTYGGTFTVTLTVTDGRGGSDTATTTADVSEVNDPPVADVGGPYSGNVGEAIAFDGSGSYDPDNDDGTDLNNQVLIYSWDFGDGNLGEGVGPLHNYSASGNYVVKLTVYDGEDYSVESTTAADIVEPNIPPTAAFTATCVDLACDFDGSGSMDSDGTIVSWAWDFGDSSSGSVPIVSHTYASGGTYGVTLTVTDDQGAIDSETQSITVTAPASPTMHIGDLDGQASDQGRYWSAEVTILVHDANGMSVGNVIVEGTWSRGRSGTSSCTTLPGGSCMVSADNLRKGWKEITFTVDELRHADFSYVPGDNNDPDGGSDGTTIIIVNPMS